MTPNIPNLKAIAKAVLPYGRAISRIDSKQYSAILNFRTAFDPPTCLALIARVEELERVCRPVLKEARLEADYMNDEYDLDNIVGVNLTIAEVRAIHAALASAAESEAKP